jgi:hypothetical protein
MPSGHLKERTTGSNTLQQLSHYYIDYLYILMVQSSVSQPVVRVPPKVRVRSEEVH